jgi:hypothetical protein
MQREVNTARRGSASSAWTVTEITGLGWRTTDASNHGPNRRHI